MPQHKPDTLLLSPENVLHMRGIYTLLILSLATSSWGQLLRKATPKTSDEAPRIMETSFDLAGGLIFVPGERNEWGESRYLLDTGAPTLILNERQRNPFNSARVVSISGSRSVGNRKIKDFQMQGMPLGDIFSLTTDLSALEKVKKRSIKGILGYRVFRPFELFIDYEKRYLMLFEKGASDLHSLVKPKAAIKIRQRGHFPIVKVKIGKKQYFFGIDTGAEVNVLDSRLERRMKRHYPELWTQKRIQGIDQNSIITASCELPEIAIGGETYEDLSFVFADMSTLSNCSDFELDGILGYPFLSSGKFSINYKDKRLYLWDDPLEELAAFEVCNNLGQEEKTSSEEKP